MINFFSHGAFLFTKFVFLSDLKLKHITKLASCLSIVHFKLGDNFSEWLSKVHHLWRIVLSISTQILQFTSLQHLGVLYLFHGPILPTLQFIHLVLSSWSIRYPVLKPRLLQTVSLIWSVPFILPFWTCIHLLLPQHLLLRCLIIIQVCDAGDLLVIGVTQFFRISLSVVEEHFPSFLNGWLLIINLLLAHFLHLLRVLTHSWWLTALFKFFLELITLHRHSNLHRLKIGFC